MKQANQRQADEELIGMSWFFAGEGYINIAIPNVKGKWYPSLRVGIATTEKLWAELFRRRFGGFLWKGKPSKKRRNSNEDTRFVFGWRVTGKEAYTFLLTIQPYLKGEKVQQLELGLEFMQIKATFYRKAKINLQNDLWLSFMDRMKDIRLAAAETNRRDAVNWPRCDSPILREIVA